MGNMAYLAPRQLSISLPTIIPPLTEVLTDTHAQVRTSANASLKKFGEVVDNPEVKAMQSTLLGALVDPTNKTLKALNTLLTTSFVHYIDPSSLALIIPIIDRGLRERSSEMKRKAAQIVGNLASLTDSKDIIGYLPQLIPRMRDVLVDPVPEARSTAAKSLGVLIERLGEDAFPTLVADLVETLKSDMSGVDQQGAAQGLSEVLAGLGVERMENMLPEIINYTSSPRAYIREGFISLLIYLPSVFGDRFAPYLGRIIQPVLSGLADESEFVREGKPSTVSNSLMLLLTLGYSLNASRPNDREQPCYKGYRSSAARTRARSIRPKLANPIIVYSVGGRAPLQAFRNQREGRVRRRECWRRGGCCSAYQQRGSEENARYTGSRQARSRACQSVYSTPRFSGTSSLVLYQRLENTRCEHSSYDPRDFASSHANYHSPAGIAKRRASRNGCSNIGRVRVSASNPRAVQIC